VSYREGNDFGQRLDEAERLLQRQVAKLWTGFFIVIAAFAACVTLMVAATAGKIAETADDWREDAVLCWSVCDRLGLDGLRYDGGCGGRLVCVCGVRNGPGVVAVDRVGQRVDRNGNRLEDGED
jgi:hypothetical protein